MPGQLLFLIGANGAGKTSILQALAFVQYFSQGRSTQFFDDRGWNLNDIRMRLPTRTIRPLRFDLQFESEFGEIAWRFAWSTLTGRVESENIEIRLPESEWKSLHAYQRPRDQKEARSAISYNRLILRGSILSILEAEDISSDHPEVISSLERWSAGLKSLELLSPIGMRRSARGTSTDIGVRGERLAGFLAGLKPAQRIKVVERVARFYDLESFEITKKRAGWIDLKLAENYPGNPKFGLAHMSDGFLRILALCSIPEFGDGASFILLDKVEDGIEPHILPKIMEMILDEAAVQFVATSHSPLLVNFFDDKQINFVCRDTNGFTVTASIAELASFQTGKEWFGAGELWANGRMDAIKREVLQAARLRESVETHMIEQEAR